MPEIIDKMNSNEKQIGTSPCKTGKNSTSTGTPVSVTA